ATGLLVFLAVVTHDFADGMNTVTFVLRQSGDRRSARIWLGADAFAPLLGAIVGASIGISEHGLGYVLALYTGFFLFIGATDRPGNRIADSLTNILATGGIAVLFLVPGIGDTFRVNGSAVIVDDPELLEPSAVEGKVPKLGILVTVEQAYTQCSKALLRSELWNPEK